MEKYKRLLKFINSFMIVALLTGVFAYMWYTNYAESTEILIKTFFRRGNYVIIGLYAVMITLFFKLYGGFKVGYLRAFEVTYSQVLSLICVNIITYLQLCLIGRWRFLDYVSPIIQMTGIQLVTIVLWVMLTRWMYTKMFPPRQLLIVYGKYSPEALMHKLASRRDKYTIACAICLDEGMDAIHEKAEIYRNVILMDLPAEERNQLLKYCFRQNIRCYSVPKISDIMVKKAQDIHLFDTALLLFRNVGLTAEQQFFKRLFDIVVSLIVVVVTMPIMLIIAICIKTYDGGPVFFTQDRLTQDGKVFKLIKFRSMKVRKEPEEYCLTRKDDDRITPVGKILRNIHFDELPQIYNILKGEMSLVGPRPECPKLAAEYQQIVPEFDFRLKVKAGLTGFAQVYGKYNTTPLDKLKLDLSYIQNYSFLLDLKLIMLTIKILFQKENTEGIENWQTTAATKENLEKIGKK